LVLDLNRLLDHTYGSAITDSISSLSSTKPSLSKGAKLGIGIGAAVAGLAITALLAVILLLLRRKRDIAADLELEDMSLDLPEMVLNPRSGHLRGGNLTRSELEAGEAQFVDSKVGAQELETGRDENVAAELDTRNRSLT
jgi:hypothetical protein